MRGDLLNPPPLGMSSTVSENVVRRAMKRMDPAAGLAWLRGELRACIEPVLAGGGRGVGSRISLIRF